MIMVLITQKRLHAFYLCVAFFGLLWVMTSYEYFCTNTDELDIREKQVEWYKQKLKESRHDIENLQGKIEDYEERLQRCYHMLQQKTMKAKPGDPNVPTIYLITPTHTRLEQKADLTRLSYTLLHVKNLHWIVVEDSDSKTQIVSNLLRSSGVGYTHLNVATPAQVKLKRSDPNWLKPRGVLQRNAGLTWLRTALKPSKDVGVVFFADDDNTYSLELFEEMRYTKTVSVWPVGLVGDLRYESPIVNDGKVTGWLTYFKPERPFAMDMAGFAVNLSLFFKHSNAWFSNNVQRGFQESTILTGLKMTLDQLEPKADGCSKVLVWHTRTEKSKTKNEARMKAKYGYTTDPFMEV